MRDLELAPHQRAVAEQPTEQALLDLYGTDSSQPHRCRPPPQRPGHDEQGVRSDDDPGPLPPPNSDQREARADGQSERAEQRQGPAQGEKDDAAGAQQKRPPERPREHDSVPTCLEPHAFVRASEHSFGDSTHGEKSLALADTARRAFIAAIVFGSVVVLALALWKIRVLIALVFLAIIIAAAMRPGVDILMRWRLPRSLGIAIQ